MSLRSVCFDLGNKFHIEKQDFFIIICFVIQFLYLIFANIILDWNNIFFSGFFTYFSFQLVLLEREHIYTCAYRLNISFVSQRLFFSISVFLSPNQCTFTYNYNLHYTLTTVACLLCNIYKMNSPRYLQPERIMESFYNRSLRCMLLMKQSNLVSHPFRVCWPFFHLRADPVTILLLILELKTF